MGAVAASWLLMVASRMLILTREDSAVLKLPLVPVLGSIENRNRTYGTSDGGVW